MAPTSAAELQDFYTSARALLVEGVVEFGIRVDRPFERVTSISSGHVDVAQQRALFTTQTLMDGQAQGGLVPFHYERGVLTFGVTAEDGATEWLRTDETSIAELGLFSLLWSRGGVPGSDSVAIRRDRVLVGIDSDVEQLVADSLDLFGCTSPDQVVHGQFGVLGSRWWSRVWSDPGDGGAPATLVTVTAARAAADEDLSLPRDVPSGPVITPELAVRLLAHDWPEDLPWRTGAS